MIVKDIADDLDRLLGRGWIVVAMPDQGDEGLPNRPAPRTLPCPRIEPDRRAEYLATGSIEKCPRNNEITGRVADTRTSKINHCTKPSVGHQKIACGYVAMNPYRRSMP